MINKICFAIILLASQLICADWILTDDVGSPYNMLISSIVINPTGQIFAGAWGYAIVTSTKNGSEWNKIGLGFSYTNITLNSKGDIFGSTYGGGVVFSTDNGETWTRNTIGLPGLVYLDDIGIGLNDDIYVIYYDGSILYRSVDNGKTWSLIFDSKPGRVGHKMGFAANGDIFFGYHRSSDNGLTWEPITNGLISGSITAFCTNSKKELYASTSRGVLRLSQSGDRWEQVTNNGLTNQYVWSMVINSNDDIYVGTDDGVFCLKYNGNSWTRFSDGITGVMGGVLSILSMAISPEGIIYAGTAWGKIYRTESSTTLSQPYQIYTDKLVSSPWNTIRSWHTTLESKNYWPVQGGLTSLKVNQTPWGSLQFSLGNWGNFIFVDPSIYKSLDFAVHGGNHGTIVKIRLLNSSGNGLMTPVTVNAIANVWTPISIPMTQLANDQFISVEFSNGGENIEYYLDNIVLNKQDSNSTQQEIIYNDNVLPLPWKTVRSWQVDLKANNTSPVYADSSSLKVTQSAWGSLQFSQGNWGNFTAIDPLKYQRLDFAIHGGTKETVVKVGARGSSNNFLMTPVSVTAYANRWTPISIPVSQIANASFISIDLSTGGNPTTYYLDNICLIDTQSVHFDKKNNNDENNHRISMNEPTDFYLSQNFPNPFNPSTTIRYGIPSSSRVSLKIYSVLGQQIAELVNSEQQTGWYETTWNANVASGLYFYRIDAVSSTEPNQRFTQLNKMLLLK